MTWRFLPRLPLPDRLEFTEECTSHIRNILAHRHRLRILDDTPLLSRHQISDYAAWKPLTLAARFHHVQGESAAYEQNTDERTVQGRSHDAECRPR